MRGYPGKFLRPDPNWPIIHRWIKRGPSYFSLCGGIQSSKKLIDFKFDPGPTCMLCYKRGAEDVEGKSATAVAPSPGKDVAGVPRV